MIADIVLPKKLIPVFSRPLGEYRYRGAFGGRGGAKSRTFALMASVFGYASPLRILCTREFQVSIRESFHAELRGAIQMYPWLEDHYDVGVDYIRGKNGTEFMFRGLRNSIGSIKSLANIDLTIVEEAEDVPDESWLALEATVFRNEKSELWPIWNPRDQGSPVDRRFRISPPDNSIIVKVNWDDNPFFPSSLNDLRIREKARLDPATYAWIWEGEYNLKSDQRVFTNWRVDDFQTPDSAQFFYGADWGFSQDPTTLIRAFLDEDNRRIYVDYQIDGIGIDIDKTPQFFDAVPGSRKQTIRADSARPETISYMNRHGYSVEGVKKGKGSVEDGVTWLKSYDIIIHPRCRLLEKELRLYSYKINKAGDILPDIEDQNDHCIDALRYAFEPLISQRAGGFIVI